MRVYGTFLAVLLCSGCWTSMAQAQTACDIAGGAVRLHMTSETCNTPLSARGKAALAAAQARPKVMACTGPALARIKAELREAVMVGGEPGIALWCDLQRQTLTGMLLK